MAHIRICLPCRIKFETQEPAGCPRCGSGSFFTMRLGDIGTAIWMDNAGVGFDELELVMLHAPSTEKHEGEGSA